MVTQTQLGEYLQEIRDEVCSRCVERPPGGPPCSPLGKICGVELHLEKLVNSISEVQSGRIQPYLDRNRHEICEMCPFLHSSGCPCPMDYLALLVVQAVETVKERRHQNGEMAWPKAPTEELTLDAIRAAYRDATDTWKGCDWPTALGKSNLDLQGITAAQATDFADACTNPQEFEDWIMASRWLGQVEHHAHLAELRAFAAMQAAEQGRWASALSDAEWAWSLEFTTGRPLRHAPPPTWQRFRDRIEVASMAHRCTASSEACGRTMLL